MPGWNPWVVLCVSEDASYQDVQRSFRRMVKQTHPDGGGDARQFATVVRAFEDVRRALPREHRPTPVPSTPYDRWLSPSRPVMSWTDDGATAPWTSVGSSGGAKESGQSGTSDFAAVLLAEMSKERTLETV